MKCRSAFVWSLALTIMAVLGILCLPAPLYAFGASSIVHAIYLIVGMDNRIFACIMLLYIAVWSVYLLVSCVLSYRGAVRPIIIAAGADLLVSAAYILYILCAAVDTPSYFLCDLIGFAIRILSTIWALMHTRTAACLPAHSKSKA